VRVAFGEAQCKRLVAESRRPRLVFFGAGADVSEVDDAHVGEPWRLISARSSVFRAVGRFSSHAAISSSCQTRLLGLINLPGGKPCASIKRFRVIRLRTMPFPTKSGYLNNFITCLATRAQHVAVLPMTMHEAIGLEKKPNSSQFGYRPL